MKTLQQRFDEKVDKTPGFGRDGDCWHWLSTCNNKGYGQFRISGGVNKLAHRLSYEMAIGVIPQGLLLLHSCDNPKCVNPAHLTPGTYKDNALDMVRKGRNVNVPTRIRQRQSYCKRGHEMTAENVITTKSGRRCRTCSTLRKRLYTAGKTASDSL